MTRESFDPIALIEATYALDLDDSAWLEELLRLAAFGLGAPWSVAVLTHVEGGVAAVEAAHAVGFDGPAELAARFFVGMPPELIDPLLRLGPRSGAVPDLLRKGIVSPAHVELQRKGAAELAATLGIPTFDSVFVARGYDLATERGALLVAPWPYEGETPRSTLARWSRVAAHLAAATRLRTGLRALPELGRAAVPAPDGAIFDPDGGCEHAEGEAKATTARERLRAAVRHLERVRGARRRLEGDVALASWNALVDGRWSLVDRFDSDGRRYVVARKNVEAVRDPRTLTEAEVSIALLLVRGLSNKAIAYELGLATSTVAERASAIARKLGMRSRVELVRALGVLFAGTDPPSAQEPGTGTR